MGVEQFIGPVIQVAATAATVIAGLWYKLAAISQRVSTLTEKVQQLEQRVAGNGASIPGECKVHAERLDEHDRRIRDIELEPLGD